MKKSSKKYSEKSQLIEKGKCYDPAQAVALVKQTAWAKFDETVDLAIKLGVDPKKHSIRGTVMLPAGSGKTRKVAVICKSDKVKEAEDAGADFVGSDDLVKKIQEGFLGFDTLIVTPDMMGAVGRLGKTLGPKGMMPNPKTGTVTMELSKTVKDFKGGKVEFKMDKTSALHMVLGKISFGEEAISGNLQAAMSAIMSIKPSGLKGNYLESIALSSTMGPAVKISPKIYADQAGAE